jgi:hypothetical protein
MKFMKMHLFHEISLDGQRETNTLWAACLFSMCYAVVFHGLLDFQ